MLGQGGGGAWAQEGLTDLCLHGPWAGLQGRRAAQGPCEGEWPFCLRRGPGRLGSPGLPPKGRQVQVSPLTSDTINVY